MKFPLYSRVILATNFPEDHLKKGDIGVVVEHLPAPDGTNDGYILELFDA